jgi:hypothetical protein
MRVVRRTVVVTWVLGVALAALPAAASAYHWPVRPFDVQHPIRAYFGDPRTVFDDPFHADGVDGSGAFSFHNGVDISAPDGTAVFPVESGIVHAIDASALSVKSLDGRTTFQYFHVVPDVLNGQMVVAGTTVLGHIQTPYEHVHLSEIDGMKITNPLLPGHLTPYQDHTRPEVSLLELHDSTGAVAAPAVVCGRLSLDAEAFDTQPLPVPGSFAGMPLAPALVTWQLRTAAGESILPPKIAVDFRHTLPPGREFWDVYARGSYQNAPRFGLQQFKTMRGRFLYRLASGVDTQRLPDGPYLLTVTAVDERGNRGSLTRRFWVDNHGGCSATPQPPPPAPAPPATTTTPAPPAQSP